MQPDNASSFSQNRVVWLFVLSAIVLVGVVLGIRMYVDHGRVIHRTQDRLLAQTRVIDENISVNMTAINLLLTNIITELRKTPGEKQLNRLLKQQLALTPSIRTLMINDSQGRCIYSNRDDLLGKDFSNRDYFKIPRNAAAKGMLFLSPPYTTLVGKYVINVTKPYFNEQGGFKGVVTITLDPEYFAALLQSTIYAPDNRVSLVHSDGTVFIAVPESAVPVTGATVNQPGSAFMQHIAGGATTTIQSTACQVLGDKRLFAYRTNHPKALHFDRQIVVAASRNLDAVLSVWWKDTGIELLFYVLFASFTVFVTRTLLRHQVELKQLENTATMKIEDEKRLLEAVMDALTIGVAITDAQGGTLQSNSAFEKIWGGSPPKPSSIDDYSAYKAWWADTDKPVAPEEWASAIAVKEGRIVAGQVMRIQRFDRAVAFILNSAAPIYDSAGNIAGSAVAVQDITDLKIAEDALRESEYFFKESQRAASIGSYKIDFVSGRWETSAILDAIFGVDADQPHNAQQWLAIVHPRDRDMMDRYLREEVLAKGMPFSKEYRIIRKNDGETRWLHGVGELRYNSEGVLVSLIGTVQDITERKQAEMALQQIREDLDRAQEVGNIGSWRLDVRSNVLTWSDENHRIFGIPKGTPQTYESFLATVHPLDRHFVDTQWQAALRGDPYDIEHRLLVEGQVKWVREKAYLEFETDGSLIGGFGITQDITKRKVAEEGLLKAHSELEQRVVERTIELADSIRRLRNEILERKKAEEHLQEETAERLRTLEALREKEQLLLQQNRQAAMGETVANIAHQWRQPLNILGLLTQRIGAFYDTPNFNKNFLDSSIAKSMEIITHMSKTIDDFRNYFKPEKDKAEFCVTETINTTLSLLEGNFQNPLISINIEARESPVIFGYQNEFAQVVLNILNNARDAIIERQIADPVISIKVCCLNGSAIITFTDNSGGVPEEIISKIFDPYFTTKGPQHGTGIGLFMSKTIIEKNMGGRLSVRNTEDGAEFRIEVDCASRI